MTTDDRLAFTSHAREQAAAMGRDQKLLRRGVEMLAAADSYDYSYLWTWLGLPIIQLPSDIVATQEVVWATQPDVIIETGVARGGSMIFLASLLELIGKGKVVGVDVDIREHNRQSMEGHRLAHRIRLIEGSSVDEETLARVKAEIDLGSSVMVILDSDHSRDHVLAECRAYGPLVTRGCYLIVADTVIGHMSESEAPHKRSQFLSRGNEPLAAVHAYLAESARFEIDPVVNGKLVLSSSPGGYLRCIESGEDTGRI